MGSKKIALFLSKGLIFFFVLFFTFFISEKVKAVSAPTLKEGTFLTGQTLSVWPSWNLLSNSTGASFPTDPINQLAPAGTCAVSTNRFCTANNQCPTGENCVIHDPETGWSVADRRFTFACSKDSYAYRYFASTTPGAYIVRAHFEDTGIAPGNFNNFVSSFVSTSIFKIDDSSGICNFDQEISSVQSGTCGDGKLNLNKGEQCDPPGRIEYANGCNGSIKKLNVCNKNCQWTPSTTLCSNLSKCGNGSVEFGETCDDGNLNGKYNHCNTTCNGLSSLGSCGDDVLQSAYEVCDSGTPGVEKYALNKSQSCNWDCQSFGPYCGDNITQSAHGEECDGSQTCSIDGKQGVKVCSNSCGKKDSDAVAWWKFEQLTGVQRLSLPIQTAQTLDSSANANTSTCNIATCPVISSGKYGQGLIFSQIANASGGNNVSESGPAGSNTDVTNISGFLTVANDESLNPAASLTIEAWIYPTNIDPLYQRIVEKGGPGTGKGYDLEFNLSSAAHTVRFNLWNGVQTSVDSNSTIPLNTWTHVAGTYVRTGNSNILKIYINGVLENTVVKDSAVSAMAKDAGNLVIGKSASANDNFFFGSLDEIKIYDRALADSEVQNNFQSGWFCSVPKTPESVPGSVGKCGDGVININEVCDKGSTDNGRPCVPIYGKPCSYCSSDCQNTIEVQPTQYCGNGTIESSEKCEVADSIIYGSTSTVGQTFSVKDVVHNGYKELPCSAEPAAPHTINKGTKSCSDCSVGVARNCIKCGVDANGVKVGGNIMNILDNPLIDKMTSVAQDPLFVKKVTSGAGLSLAISLCKSPSGALLCSNLLDAASPLVAVALKNINSDLLSYNLGDLQSSGTNPALISSNPVCSVSDSFNDKYQMYINNDWTRPVNFPVVAEPQPWQYDLVLSPVVSSVNRPKDLRVVVSWVGSGDLYSGVLNPFLPNPQTVPPTSPQVEGAIFYNDSGYQYANGVNYYNSPVDFKKSSVWYHGFNSTPGQTSAEAYTIDTSAMSGNTYSFYVRAPSFPIRIFRNTAKLKVDVYLPEQDSNPYHFGTPIKTYYLSFATPSDNQNARYWQVFNVNQPLLSASSLSASDIIDVNAIISSPASFIYTNSLIPNHVCADADWSRSPSTTPPCSASGVWTYNWTKLTNCINGVQHSAVENVTCPACTDADWTRSPATNPSSCPASGVWTTNWTKIGNCAGGVTHQSTETTGCRPCTDADWVSNPPFNPNCTTQVGTFNYNWTKVGQCTGGVTHPPVQSVTCRQCNGADWQRDPKVYPPCVEQEYFAVTWTKIANCADPFPPQNLSCNCLANHTVSCRAF